LAENQVPAGFYDEFELEVERPDDEDDFVSDSDFRGDNGWYSIVVKGLYNGVEFTYRSTQDFEIETDLNPPLEIGENESAEMVIEIDVNSWFKDSSGMYMDPSDEANRSRIDGNIENSFEGYEDDDDDDKSENSEKAWAEAEFTNTGVDPDASGEAEYEERTYRTEFKVEIEDLDIGTYELWVGGEQRGEIQVTMDDDGTEGEIEFRNPAESGKEELNFDPLGQLITIEQSGTIFLTLEFPSELNFDDDDDDDHDDDDDDDDDDDNDDD
ncbi:MAG: hypothetical protein R3283_00310, partial [Balneolaceae bacterium]|nr:hypothetical protein [Balneolaceae bacterium]